MSDISINMFMWFQNIALNADNLAADKTVYIAATGCIDILGYITSIIFLRYIGRKLSSMLLFGVSGLSMLLLLAVPLGERGEPFKANMFENPYMI